MGLYALHQRPAWSHLDGSHCLSSPQAEQDPTGSRAHPFAPLPSVCAFLSASTTAIMVVRRNVEVTVPFSMTERGRSAGTEVVVLVLVVVVVVLVVVVVAVVVLDLQYLLNQGAGGGGDD
ncbi:unnamed protein product [Arctogadus glacialis]